MGLRSFFCCKRKQSVELDDGSGAKEVKQAASADSGGGRAQWSSPTEFLLTCIGYSVGLGNVWRFPYLCYKSGGGAFLIPYIVFMFLIGMPLLFMEYSFGQYFGVGGLTIFKRVCPMFQGVGFGYITLNALVCIYYNVIIATALYYLFASFTSDLPWASCGHSWNTPQCGDPIVFNASAANATDLGNSTYFGNGTFGNDTMNGTYANSTVRFSPSDEYFRHALMNVGPEHNIENLGGIRWHLCLCLLLAWILVVLFVSRGIKSTGKVAYFTATFPYLMMTVLVVRGVTLPGSATGILYFLTPVWSKLADPDVWFGAATQLFYSTNLAWGGMITMASYNNFSHNCYRDAVMINFVSFFTSMYAGLAVFSIIGYMANEYNLNIEEVIDSGPGLAFIVYPRALSMMPIAPMWSALFFFMLFLLGVGSQMVLIETVVTGFVDEFPRLGRNGCVRLMTTICVAVLFFAIGIPQTTQMVDLETVMSGICDEFPVLRRNRFKTLCVVSTIFFLLGLPQVTQGGMYVLQLMDWYSAGFCVLIIAFVEAVVINWVYGNEKFAANVKEMLGNYPAKWWRICWKYISPLAIIYVLVFCFVRYEPAKYGEYVYPVWADLIGWCLALLSVIPMVLTAIIKYARAKGDTWKEKWINATRCVVPIEQKQVSTIELESHDKVIDLETAPYDDEERLDNQDEAEAQKHTLLQNNTVTTNAETNHHGDNNLPV